MVEALALGFGLGPGGLLPSLALAQRMLDGAAILVAGIGEANQQVRPAAPGAEFKKVIQSVGLALGEWRSATRRVTQPNLPM
ncbi:MAG: hypothetical protein EOO58_00130 [Hymenobacter sp.]|nr:MAG: hypothetical protein EOO58_00130 [Hymenobacter sp.]